MLFQIHNSKDKLLHFIFSQSLAPRRLELHPNLFFCIADMNSCYFVKLPEEKFSYSPSLSRGDWFSQLPVILSIAKNLHLTGKILNDGSSLVGSGSGMTYFRLKPEKFAQNDNLWLFLIAQNRTNHLCSLREGVLRSDFANNFFTISNSVYLSSFDGFKAIISVNIEYHAREYR